MKFKRAGGILLHPTSLPGPYGIGDLGPKAYQFVDWLASTGCKLWQVLPLGPTGYGDSPYQLFSSRAGNPYFIDLGELISAGLLRPGDFLKVAEGLGCRTLRVRDLHSLQAELRDAATASGPSGAKSAGMTTNRPRPSRRPFRATRESWCNRSAPTATTPTCRSAADWDR